MKVKMKFEHRTLFTVDDCAVLTQPDPESSFVSHS